MYNYICAQPSSRVYTTKGGDKHEEGSSQKNCLANKASLQNRKGVLLHI